MECIYFNILPTLKDVWRIHHNADVPDIVIIANGDQFSSERAITHFVPTQHLKNTSKVVASNTAAQDHIEQLHGDTNGYKEGTRVLFLHEFGALDEGPLLSVKSFEEAKSKSRGL